MSRIRSHRSYSQASKAGWETRRAAERAAAEWQRHLEASERSRRGWEIRRAAERAAAEWQRHLEASERSRRGWETRRKKRTPVPSPTLSTAPDRIEHKSFMEVQDITKSEIDSDTRVNVSLDFGSGPLCKYDGPAEKWDPHCMKRELDNWEESEHWGMAYKSPNSWRAPGVRIFQVEYWQALGKVPTQIKVTVAPDALSAIKSVTGNSGMQEPVPPEVGKSLPVFEPEPEGDDIPV